MHACPVRVCDAPVPNDRLMCRSHWFMVPPDLQTAVWRAYHQSQARPEDRQRLDTLRELQRQATAAVDEKLEATMQPRPA